jgi:hypothetical protein
LHEKKQGQKSIYKLDQGVLDGDAGLAGAASAAENEVADNRNIIVPAYPVIASRAVGRREYDGFAFRQTAYAYIQERTDHGAEDKCEDVKDDDWGHCSHGSGIACPFRGSSFPNISRRFRVSPGKGE